MRKMSVATLSVAALAVAALAVAALAALAACAPSANQARPAIGFMEHQVSSVCIPQGAAARPGTTLPYDWCADER